MEYPQITPRDIDVLWRCEAKRYSVCIDSVAELYESSKPRLEMTWWKVKKRTSKGAWLDHRFVLLTAHKKWACNTCDEALESFKARKKRQIKILTAQLNAAKEDLALSEKQEVFV